MLALPQTLVRSTLLGGPANTFCSYFALDERKACYVTGHPFLQGFPVTPDAYDTTYHTMFLARMSRDLRHLEYSTYIGGSGFEEVYGLLYEGRHAVWLTGSTSSPDLPTTPNGLNQLGAPGFLFCLSLPDSAEAAPTQRMAPPSSLGISAFPNPFNPSTTLTFTLSAACPVTLEVFNVLGRKVYGKDFGRMSAGEHRQQFDATEFASGIYFARVQAGNAVRVHKMMVLR